MWPADALWDLAQQILTLGAILVAYAFARRKGGVERRLRLPSFRIEPRARRLLGIVGLAALFTTAGWLGQAATLGVERTLAMALGGPSAEEVDYCRRRLAGAAPGGSRPACVFGKPANSSNP